MTGVSGAEGSNQYTAVSTVEPSSESNIRITLEVNQTDKFDVTGIAAYYFGDNEANSERFEETVTITAGSNGTDESRPTPQDTSGASGPSFVIGTALGGVTGSAALIKWLHNKHQYK